jgi:hypothetical protein
MLSTFSWQCNLVTLEGGQQQRAESNHRTMVRIVCACSQGDQSRIMFVCGDEAFQVMSASLTGTLTQRVITITTRVQSVAIAAQMNALLL